MLLTLLYFIYVTYGLGLIADFFVKWKDNFFEKLVMRIGFGIAFFTLFGIIFDLLFIPLHFLVFFLLSTFFYGYFFYKNKSFNFFGHFKLNKLEIISIFVVFVLFIITAYMYIGGSLSYSYMENGDPWGYTTVSKVISEEMTFRADYKYNHYAEPYTQGYQILMGILHQTNDSIYLNMKFFHNFILSLGILFFFFFAKELFKNRKGQYYFALFSTIVFFSIPSWVSHFIFSLSFNMTLFLVLLYALFKINNRDNWKLVCGLVFGSILVNHFFTSFVILLFLVIYFFIKTIIDKELSKNIFEVILIGIFCFLLYFIPTTMRHPSFIFTDYVRQSHGGLEQIIFPLFSNLILLLFLIILFILFVIFIYKEKLWFKYISRYFFKKNYIKFIFIGFFIIFLIVLILPFKILEISGSADREYTFKDFFVASSQNMINNPIGWGYFISFFVLIGLIVLFLNYKDLFEKKYFDYLFILFMFILFFLLTHGKKFSISIMPFRMWTFLAIFVALICGVGIYFIFYLIKNKNFYIATFIVFIILGCIVYTSFIPKYKLNNMPWPDEQLIIPESHNFYDYIRNNFESNTKMISICRDSDFLVSYNMMPIIVDKNFNREYGRDKELKMHYDLFYERNSSQIYDFLKNYEIDYFVMGVSCVIRDLVRNQNNQQYYLEKIQNKTIEIGSYTNYFELIYSDSTNAEFLFKVK